MPKRSISGLYRRRIVRLFAFNQMFSGPHALQEGYFINELMFQRGQNMQQHEHLHGLAASYMRLRPA